MDWNKKIVITGASKGLGYELTRQLTFKGASILAIARTYTELSTLQTECKSYVGQCYILACDLRSPEGIKKVKDWLEENWKSVDLFINNAALGHNSEIVGCTISFLRHSCQSDCHATIEIN
jgi:short-subunit dehydrogenase